LLLTKAEEELMSTAFRVILEGNQEVPPTNSDARGLGTVIFDSEAVAASYTFQVNGVDYGTATGRPPQTPELLDDVTSTHFHNQVRGQNGPVVFGQINPAQDTDDLAIVPNADGSWTVSGRWETTDPANVSIANFAATLGSAPVGSEVPIYFNVHTNQFPGGEIRGQLIAIADDSNNIVVGTTEDDLLPGLGGNDIVTGLEGDDTLQGGDGDDILIGNEGNDDINTGAGDDLVVAGDGNDTVGGMAGKDIVFGGAGDDQVIWNDPTGDVVSGDDGNDFLRGGDVAADTISGGDGADIIRAVANQSLATHAPDVLFGENGDDVIIGGNASDTIEGGAGSDILSGLGGADQFVFRALPGDATTPNSDLITDFGTGEDIVVLNGFGAGFDPLENLSAGTTGAVLDLGNSGQVVFLGRLVNEFTVQDFLVIA
jgi:Ca2+-binding RTX toxin-like protein